MALLPCTSHHGAFTEMFNMPIESCTQILKERQLFLLETMKYSVPESLQCSSMFYIYMVCFITEISHITLTACWLIN